MKLASKFIAALAVVASSSSFAADLIVIDDLAALDSYTAAVDFAVEGSAAIAQTTDAAAAAISQTGANAAVIVQMVEATAAISQVGTGNTAVIFQGE